MRVTLPPLWIEQTNELSKNQDFARTYYATKVIEYYPKWWALGIWCLMLKHIKNHERAHAHGIKDCLSRDKSCIMYEDNDTYFGKLKLLFGQLAHGLSFCPECEKFLIEKGAIEE